MLPIVHVDDACRALELLATDAAADSKPYLVVADNVSVAQVVGVLDGAPPRDREDGAGPLKAVRPLLPFRLRSMVLPELRVNAARIRALGWEPKVSWSDAVAEVDARVQARATFAIEPGGWSVVTGAGSGLGRAVAARIAPNRSRLLLVDRDASGLAATAEQLSDAVTLVADVTDPDTPRRIAETIGRRDGHLAELFLCAGLGRKGSVGQVDVERELASIDVNLRARIATVTELLRELTQRHYGRIVLVSSSSAFQPLPEFASYGAATAGLLAFGQALAAELDDSGVQVLTVCPGGMDTGFQAAAGVRRLENEHLLDPAAVADRIVDALDRHDAVAVIGTRAKSMDVLARVLPRSVQRRLWKRLVRDLR
jgi:short-subunit dehydrogenase